MTEDRRVTAYKQDIWEHPRNIAILVAATATLFSAIAGVVGYKIGQTPSPPPVIINVPAPAAAAK